MFPAITRRVIVIHSCRIRRLSANGFPNTRKRYGISNQKKSASPFGFFVTDETPTKYGLERLLHLAGAVLLGRPEYISINFRTGGFELRSGRQKPNCRIEPAVGIQISRIGGRKSVTGSARSRGQIDYGRATRPVRAGRANKKQTAEIQNGIRTRAYDRYIDVRGRR